MPPAPNLCGVQTQCFLALRPLSPPSVAPYHPLGVQAPTTLRERLAAFERCFQEEHGRRIAPTDGPNLPKEVLAMYRECEDVLDPPAPSLHSLVLVATWTLIEPETLPTLALPLIGRSALCGSNYSPVLFLPNLIGPHPHLLCTPLVHASYS